MNRFVLYYDADGDAPASDVRRLEQDPHTAIVSAARDMVLLDSDQATIDQFLAESPGWFVTRGAQLSLPVESGFTRALRRL